VIAIIASIAQGEMKIVIIRKRIANILGGERYAGDHILGYHMKTMGREKKAR